jgi:hypothetical protein
MPRDFSAILRDSTYQFHKGIFAAGLPNFSAKIFTLNRLRYRCVLCGSFGRLESLIKNYISAGQSCDFFRNFALEIPKNVRKPIT